MKQIKIKLHDDVYDDLIKVVNSLKESGQKYTNSRLIEESLLTLFILCKEEFNNKIAKVQKEEN